MDIKKKREPQNSICAHDAQSIYGRTNYAAENVSAQNGIMGQMRNWNRRDDMVFNTGSALLDAIVLAVVSKEPEGTYGYKITQDVRQVIELSESTLYPVLRRLQKDECLEVYDMECAGRNRRYYKVTSKGWAQLRLYESEWRRYSDKITGLFEGRTDSISNEGKDNPEGSGNKL